MNKVMLVGYIGKKGVELKYTPGDGKAVSSYTISVPRPFKEKEYDYINCVTWGKQAEFLANNQDKIKKLEIEGRLQVRSYDAKDGTKKYVTEVVTDNVGVAEWGEKQNTESNDLRTPSLIDNRGLGDEMTPVDDGDIPF